MWATVLFAGLRRGELLALEWLDLSAGLIRIERSWDVQAGTIEPKSVAGRRRVSIPAGLRDPLLAHRLRQGRGGTGLVFGRSAADPVDPSTVLAHARRAWKAARVDAIGLHECRHTFASLMIAAGVNAKALSAYLGHASVSVTYDIYGHLMPGSEAEAANLFDGYIARQQFQQPCGRER